MFNVVSLIIGAVALVLALIAFIPLLGWANWFIIPLAIIGAGVGMVGRGTAGRNLNLFVIVVGVLRLMLGGGILCAAIPGSTPISRKRRPMRGRFSSMCGNGFTQPHLTRKSRSNGALRLSWSTAKFC